MIQPDNEHIREFLRYYSGLETPPEYAVLISGLWGSGKTWFVKDFLVELQRSEQEHIYVSLHGMSSVDDIESEFFRQLHPLLASKGVRLLGKFAKGLLKTSINFDIDGDNKPDGSVTLGMPNERLFESVKLSENKILVFDDVERCAIPFRDLLGYINNFVEHGGFKIILVADESEILKKEEGNTTESQTYQRIKEKLVGRTFEVIPEFIPALTHFTKQLSSEDGRLVISENLPLIAQLYKSSEYLNLRILRHALWDFDRIFTELAEPCKENKALISQLLALFLIYAFEVRSGNIEPTKLVKLSARRYSKNHFKKDEPNPDQKYVDIANKYHGIDLNNSLFSESIWTTIFTSGLIPAIEINEALSNSRYFESEKQPNWVRFWHSQDLSDSDFEKLLATIENEWKGFIYKNVGEIKHVAGLLLEMSDAGLYNEGPNQILEFSKQCIDRLKAEGLLQPSPRGVELLFGEESYGGLGFFSVEKAAFKELMLYISEQRKVVLLESYKIEAINLLNLMKEDVDKFMRVLILSNHEDNQFYDTPILAEITPIKFVETFLNLTPGQRRTVGYTFAGRYQYQHYNVKLISELGWLRQVIQLLNEEKNKRVGKMSGHMIGLLIESPLTEALQALESLPPSRALN